MEKYEGPALLILAPDTPEFHSAAEINAQYCTQMEVVNGKGSHYNMMQGEQAATQAAIVLEWAKRLGGVANEILPSAGIEAAKSQKMLIMRPGKAESAKIYLIHGLDGDAMSGGSTFTSIAQRLAPCRVGALVYDQEALECNSIPELAACYNRRVVEDAKSHNPAGESLIIVAGYSHGCVLAHQMGHQLHKAGIWTAVVMFDLEVIWPPPSNDSRVGGYDFLGGEAEATLLISRAFGKFDFAIKEAIELTEMKARGQSIDVDALIERAYAALNQRGLSINLLKMMVKRGGVNIDKLHNIGNPWEP
ncbi:DNA repair and recombination protein RAD54B, partial [Durusdinium trenchii]